MDARDYGFEKSANYEVYYTKLRLQGAGAFDGAEEGLSTYAIKKIQDTAISNVEGLDGLANNRPWSGHSIFPSLLTDDQNNAHCMGRFSKRYCWRGGSVYEAKPN